MARVALNICWSHLCASNPLVTSLQPLFSVLCEIFIFISRCWNDMTSQMYISKVRQNFDTRVFKIRDNYISVEREEAAFRSWTMRFHIGQVMKLYQPSMIWGRVSYLIWRFLFKQRRQLYFYRLSQFYFSSYNFVLTSCLITKNSE